MKKKLFDPWLIIISLFLISLGIILVYSSTYTFSYTRTGDPYFLFTRHVIGVGLGLLALLGAVFIPLDFLRSKVKILVPLTILLLIVALVPGLSKKAGGASRWINLGFFSFQPSEIAKLTIILYLASILEKRQAQLKNYFQGTLPPLLLCSVMAGVILFQKDFSTTVFVVALSMVLLYVAGAKFIHIFISLLLSIPALLPFIFSSGYRLNRIKMLFSVEQNPMASYQLFQALEAFKRGGLLGLGPGKGLKKAPSIFNDFIFSVAGEELGLVGCLVILLLFIFLWQRGLKIARHYPSGSFQSILSFGLTFLLVSQAFLNIAVNLAIIFPTGINLPFISYGRTSFIVSSIAVGWLIQLSRGVNVNSEKPVQSVNQGQLNELL